MCPYVRDNRELWRKGLGMEQILGTDLLLPKCYHVLSGGPPVPSEGELEGLKIFGCIERYRIGQRQAIETILPTVIPVGPQTLCYADGSSSPSGGGLGPQNSPPKHGFACPG